jgi:hypothetical protein
MAGNPAESPSPGGRQPAAAVAPPERVGPVSIARYAKDDGRALILYARANEPPERHEPHDQHARRDEHDRRGRA